MGDTCTISSGQLIDVTTAKSATEKPAKTRKVKTDDKLSQLDAAVKVLTESGEPMTTKAMIDAMASHGYWTSPGGATPWATLYSVLIREIANKGDESRFTKVDRGQFALSAATTPTPKTKGKKSAKKSKPADGTPARRRFLISSRFEVSP
ncbi:MAG: winged helix-turn-helix domain-containing protein [Planctomycetaceae bacterium]